MSERIPNTHSIVGIYVLQSNLVDDSDFFSSLLALHYSENTRVEFIFKSPAEIRVIATGLHYVKCVKLQPLPYVRHCIVILFGFAGIPLVFNTISQRMSSSKYIYVCAAHVVVYVVYVDANETVAESSIFRVYKVMS